MSILKVSVGGSVERNLARFGEALARAKSGRSVTPYFGTGFRTMAQFGVVREERVPKLVPPEKHNGSTRR